MDIYGIIDELQKQVKQSRAIADSRDVMPPPILLSVPEVEDIIEYLEAGTCDAPPSTTRRPFGKGA